MTTADREITVGIQRPGAVDNIDIGPLISEFTVEPWELVQDFSSGYFPEASIEISVERTHEWEYLIIFYIAGGDEFINAVMQALGDRFGHWIADQVGSTSRTGQEIKITTESGTEITISSDQIDQSADKISIELEEAGQTKEKLSIEM